MAETGTNTEQQTDAERTEARQEREGVRAVHAVLQFERDKMEAGNGRDPATQEGKALNIFNRISESQGWTFDQSGNPISVLEEVNVTDEGGKIHDYKKGEISIAGFYEDPDGNLICHFRDQSGNIIPDSNGGTVKDADGNDVPQRLQIKYDRDVVLQFQINAEADVYKDFFQGDREQLFDAYTGKRKFGADLGTEIDKIKQETGAKIKDEDFAEEQNTPNEVDTPAGREINAQIEILDDLISQYEARSGRKEKNAVRHAERIRAGLALALKATGPIGPLQQIAALTAAREAYDKELKITGVIVPSGLDAMLRNTVFLDQVELAKREMQDGLGLTDAEIASLDEPGGYERLIAEPKFADKEDQLFENTFGDAGKTEIYGLIDDIKQSHMNINDAEWKNKLKDFVTRNPGKKLGILAIIFASIPVAAAALAAAAAVGTAGAVGGGRR